MSNHGHVPLSIRKVRVPQAYLNALTFGESPKKPGEGVVIPDLFQEQVEDVNVLWDELMSIIVRQGGYGSLLNDRYRRPLMLSPDALYSNPIQPAVRIDDWNMRIELASTIRYSEYISPITCVPDPHLRGHFILGDGEGRTIIAAVNNIPTVPVIIHLQTPEALFLTNNAGGKRIQTKQMFQIYGDLTARREWELLKLHESVLPKGTMSHIRRIKELLSEDEWLPLARSGEFAPSIMGTAETLYKCMDAARMAKRVGYPEKKGSMPTRAQTLLWMKTFNGWEKAKIVSKWPANSDVHKKSMAGYREAILSNRGVKEHQNHYIVMDPTQLPPDKNQGAESTTKSKPRSKRETKNNDIPHIPDLEGLSDNHPLL